MSSNVSANPKILPLVTVYIANHNYGHFVKQAIESVLAQTFDDYELIVIDDGSTDNSREVIEEYADHPNIIPVFQNNRGLTTTNNIAIRLARGEYIMRLDADDYLHPEALEKLYDAITEDENIGLVFPDYFETDEDGKVIAEVRRHDFDHVTLHDQPAHGACTLIRHRCLEEVGGYDENFGCQDGLDLWIHFVERFEVRNVNQPLFYYRQHGSNLTRDEPRLYEARAQILNRHAKIRGHDLKAVAIVPVRGNVSDPRSPTMLELGGKPLLDWTIDEALSAKHLDGVVLTSPDTALLSYADQRWHGRVTTVCRDPVMARPNTQLAGTLRHALEAYEKESEEMEAVMVLSVESPFRTARYIDTAVNTMELFDTDAVLGVRTETDLHYRHDGNGLIPLRRRADLRLEREELYREVGHIRLLKRHLVYDNDALPSGRVSHVVLDQKAALNVRTELDWKIAELIAADMNVLDRISQAGGE